MFIYQIDYLISNEIYLAGIRSSLDKLASTHPHWHYQMVQWVPGAEYDARMTIYDLTESQTIEEYLSRSIPNKPRSLLLLRVHQKELISALVQTSRCSILCVDEVHFQMRELVETLMKKKRYLSQLVNLHQTISLPPSLVALTRTESIVLDYLSEGRSGVDISKVLFRSEKTISTHKRSIMKKLNVTNDLELRKCIQHYDNKPRGLLN